MINWDIREDQLHIAPKTLDKLWGFQGDLVIPKSNIRGVTTDSSIALEKRGLRGPGLAVPGKYVGTFYRDEEKSYWNVSNVEKVIVISLEHEDFERLVLTVEAPLEAERSINTWLHTAH